MILSADTETLEHIKTHPMALWKSARKREPER